MNNKSNELIDLFMRFEWLYRRFQLQNQRHFGPMADPHRGQGRVLALLKLQPEISQKELSNILDIRSQSLGELLTKLEKAGYITRMPSEKDRRVMMVRLTKDGEAAANMDSNKAEEVKPFSCLDEAEAAQLIDYMDRIVAELEKHCEPYSGERMGRGGRRPFPYGRDARGMEEWFGSRANEPFHQHHHPHDSRGRHRDD